MERKELYTIENIGMKERGVLEFQIIKVKSGLEEDYYNGKVWNKKNIYFKTKKEAEKKLSYLNRKQVQMNEKDFRLKLFKIWSFKN